MNDKAEIGIGTMIVFIASVLVAAVAAAILVNTSGLLQAKGKNAGEQSIKRVASNIEVTRIMASRAAAGTDMERVQLYVSLAPGGSKVDLKSLIFQWKSGTSTFINVAWDGNYPAGAPGGTNDGSAGGYFLGVDPLNNPTLMCVRDDDGSVQDVAVAGNGAALTPGDICAINFDVLVGLGDPPPGPMTLGPTDQVELTIIPSVGSPVHSDFIMPETFGADLVVTVAN